jgi:putative tryptophan/tyrosine transport system substrate-binding protein
VFVLISDPVSADYVANLNRPGGNTTGFSFVENSTSGKWLELLKQIAPDLTQMAVLYDPAAPPANGQLNAIQSVAASFAVEVVALSVRDAAEITARITEFAHSPSGRGLIMTSVSLTIANRELISALASRFRLPAVYGFPVASGLVSYAPDAIEQYRRAAGYVHRILKGERPGDLPVQNPTKFNLVINLKTSKALGVTVPPNLLAIADEVIE